MGAGPESPLTAAAHQVRQRHCLTGSAATVNGYFQRYTFALSANDEASQLRQDTFAIHAETDVRN